LEAVFNTFRPAEWRLAATRDSDDRPREAAGFRLFIVGSEPSMPTAPVGLVVRKEAELEAGRSIDFSSISIPELGACVQLPVVPQSVDNQRVTLSSIPSSVASMPNAARHRRTAA
jgi:hypothetical protein